MPLVLDLDSIYEIEYSNVRLTKFEKCEFTSVNDHILRTSITQKLDFIASTM